MSAGGSYLGASGSLSLDIKTLDENVDENTQIGESLMSFTIGSADVPLPIHTKVVPIIEAMGNSFWDTNERDTYGISQKRTHMDKALTDYATNKQARINAGMLVICRSLCCNYSIVPIHLSTYLTMLFTYRSYHDCFSAVAWWNVLPASG